LTAIGTGVAVYSSNQAANAQSSIAIENAKAQQAAARASSQSQQMALRFQQLQQDAISQSSSLQAQALLAQSEAATTAAQQNIRRQREQFDALVAQQYAALGQAGVSPVTGSPLDALMANAAVEQEQEMLMRDEDEDRRRQAVREAVALQGTSFSAGTQSSLLSLERGGARQQGRMAVAQAGLDAMSARAGARGTRNAALGSAVGSLGGLAVDGARFRSSYKTVS